MSDKIAIQKEIERRKAVVKMQRWSKRGIKIRVINTRIWEHVTLIGIKKDDKICSQRSKKDIERYFTCFDKPRISHLGDSFIKYRGKQQYRV